MLDNLLLYLLGDWDGIPVPLLYILENLLLLDVLFGVLNHLLHLLQPLDQNSQYLWAFALETQCVKLFLREQGNVVFEFLPYQVLHFLVGFSSCENLNHLFHEVGILLLHLRYQLVKEELDLPDVVDLFALLCREPYFRILNDVVPRVLRVVYPFD